MIHIDFVPGSLTNTDVYTDRSGKQWQVGKWWAQWKKRSEKTKGTAISDANSNRQHNFQDQIWRELKHFLLEKVFSEKCAYCESKITAIYPGDAEHYRPKGKVTIKDGNTQRVVEYNGKPHPGYYWLSYHWKNLLPACSECNSNEGKMNQFPVKKVHISHHVGCEDPDILDRLESPLLLHPYRDEPEKHICFGDFGVISAINNDEIGTKSIEVYNLGRDKLNDIRYMSQQDAFRECMVYVMANKPFKDALEIAAGRSRAHSKARRDYILLKIQELALQTG